MYSDMKLNIFIGVMMAASVMAASCSAARSTSSSTTTSGAQASSISIKPDKKKDKKAKPETVSAPTRYNKPTPDELCGGEWVIVAVGEVKIDEEENGPYAHFTRDGRFYASDGCNIINGDYALRSDGTIGFSHVLSTMKYCPSVEYSALIASIFGNGDRYTTDCRRIGQDTYLYLKNKAGNNLMTLLRQNMEFLNGNWRITSVDGRAVDDDEANIFIDIAELKIHGNTGCNYFNGEIYIDPSRANAVDFSNMGVTRMACPKGDQERMILVALEETKTAIASHADGTVLLINKDGKELLTLKRIPLPE